MHLPLEIISEIIRMAILTDYHCVFNISLTSTSFCKIIKILFEKSDFRKLFASCHLPKKICDIYEFADILRPLYDVTIGYDNLKRLFLYFLNELPTDGSMLQWIN